MLIHKALMDIIQVIFSNILDSFISMSYNIRRKRVADSLPFGCIKNYFLFLKVVTAIIIAVNKLVIAVSSSALYPLFIF